MGSLFSLPGAGVSALGKEKAQEHQTVPTSPRPARGSHEAPGASREIKRLCGAGSRGGGSHILPHHPQRCPGRGWSHLLLGHPMWPSVSCRASSGIDMARADHRHPKRSAAQDQAGLGASHLPRGGGRRDEGAFRVDKDPFESSGLLEVGCRREAPRADIPP